MLVNTFWSEPGRYRARIGRKNGVAPKVGNQSTPEDYDLPLDKSEYQIRPGEVALAGLQSILLRADLTFPGACTCKLKGRSQWRGVVACTRPGAAPAFPSKDTPRRSVCGPLRLVWSDGCPNEAAILAGTLGIRLSEMVNLTSSQHSSRTASRIVQHIVAG